MKVLVDRSKAGWSTQGYPKLATDMVIIQAFERGISKEDLQALCNDLGYTHLNFNCYDTLEVVDIPKGQLFRIVRRENAELIDYFEPNEWTLSKE